MKLKAVALILGTSGALAAGGHFDGFHHLDAEGLYDRFHVLLPRPPDCGGRQRRLLCMTSKRFYY